MQFRPKVAVIAVALGASVVAASDGRAATLRFTGGAAPALPTDVASYLQYVYCDRLPRGAAATDRGCRAVAAWMLSNAGKPRAAWSPPPLID